jgi:hypothetical protein
MVMDEISFLRELYPCENVITLQSVHKTSDLQYQLVLEFAQYGCLRAFLLAKRGLKEE